jgi:hypothetical protein
MNPEAHKLLEKMTASRPASYWLAAGSQVEITIDFAKLLVVLAEDAEKNAEKTAQQTKQLIRLC